MSQDLEEPVAWRLFTYNWVPLGLMALALVLAMALTGFSITITSTPLPIGMAAAYVGYAYHKAHWATKRDPRVIFILGSTGQILLIPVLITPMTYVAASANFPLVDAPLMALDRALGLDWMAQFNFNYSHHALLNCRVLAYGMIGWQVFGVPIVLGATCRYRRLQEFTLAFAIALAATTAISAFTPALGTYDFLHVTTDPNIFTPGAYLDQLKDLPMVRDGSLRHLELMKLTGIVTFPSFHAAAATLYLWALWPVRWFRPIAVVANVAMLLATPLGGGHYFVDVFAGVAVAAAAIMAAQWIARLLARPVMRPMAATFRQESIVPAE
jgi:membrane-associated phospholipid phosphatase